MDTGSIFIAVWHVTLLSLTVIYLDIILDIIFLDLLTVFNILKEI